MKTMLSFFYVPRFAAVSANHSVAVVLKMHLILLSIIPLLLIERLWFHLLIHVGIKATQ